jgi:hypothetical protein
MYLIEILKGGFEEGLIAVQRYSQICVRIVTEIVLCSSLQISVL